MWIQIEHHGSGRSEEPGLRRELIQLETVPKAISERGTDDGVVFRAVNQPPLPQITGGPRNLSRRAFLDQIAAMDRDENNMSAPNIIALRYNYRSRLETWPGTCVVSRAYMRVVYTSAAARSTT